MPILVNELVVKATIAEPDRAATSQASNQQDLIERKDIVEACVEEVLKILERQKER